MRDRALLDRLDVGPETRLIDYGCGTGSFLVAAARRGGEVYGVDVSEQMLELAGFEILSSDFPRPTHGELLCRRL